MAFDVVAYAAARQYINKTINGTGAIKGKNCTISDITKVEGGNDVTFSYTLDNGDTETQTMFVADGLQGEQGPKGTTFVPNIDDSGNLRWTNDGGLDNPLPIKIDYNTEVTQAVTSATEAKTSAEEAVNIAEAASTVTKALEEDLAELSERVDNMGSSGGEGGSTNYPSQYAAGTGIQISDDNIISTKDVKKNYVDNSNFRINRSGANEYSTPNGYTVDRWYIDGGILTVLENGVRFTNTNAGTNSSDLVRLRQNIHYSFSEFAGKTLTLSAKINDVIYSGTATIPAERPTETSAVQYITAGIADFAINLNYSVTGDYFVPFFSLAYNRSAVFEWMKLEVNNEFSGYIEPDYMTELIKINFTTPDKGALKLPTEGGNVSSVNGQTGVVVLTANDVDAVSTKGWAPNLILCTDANGNIVTKDVVYTETEKAELIQEIINSIKVENPGAHVIYGDVDENNNITIYGALASGTYTLKYEDEDGNTTSIGTVEISEENEDGGDAGDDNGGGDNTGGSDNGNEEGGGDVVVAYTNQIPLSINSDGTLYNDGQGWKTGYRLNSTGSEKEQANMEITGYIPVKYNDVIRMKNIVFNYSTTYKDYRDWFYVQFFDSSFTFLGYFKTTTNANLNPGAEPIVITDANQQSIGIAEYTPATGKTAADAVNVAYIRVCSYEITNDSVITVNEEM